MTAPQIRPHTPYLIFAAVSGFIDKASWNPDVRCPTWSHSASHGGVHRADRPVRRWQHGRGRWTLLAIFGGQHCRFRTFMRLSFGRYSTTLRLRTTPGSYPVVIQITLECGVAAVVLSALAPGCMIERLAPRTPAHGVCPHGSWALLTAVVRDRGRPVAGCAACSLSHSARLLSLRCGRSCWILPRSTRWTPRLAPHALAARERLPIDLDEHEGIMPRRTIHPGRRRNGSCAGIETLPQAARREAIRPARRQLARAFLEALVREGAHNLLGHRDPAVLLSDP
jgi:hypothetical protein